MKDGAVTSGAGVTPPRHRYLALDGYRFLAAAAIVTFHFNYDFRLGLSDVSRAFDKLFVYVDFFFVLSGFVIAGGYLGRIRRWRDHGTFLWRRLARIYPLHVLTLSLLVAGVETAAATGWLGARHEIYDRAMLPQTFLLVHAWGTTRDMGWNLPSWSISAEFLAYALFPALSWAVLRMRPVAGLLAALVLFVGLQALRSRLGLYDLTNATSDGAMRVLPSFLAGMAVFRIVDAARTLPSVPWPVVHAAFLLPLACMHLGLPESLAVVQFPAIVLLAALAERTRGPGLLGSRPATALGHASYALYMVHFPVALVALHVVGRPGWLDGTASRWAFALSTAAAALAVAAVAYRRFELPAQAAMLGLLRPRARRVAGAPAPAAPAAP